MVDPLYKPGVSPPEDAADARGPRGRPRLLRQRHVRARPDAARRRGPYDDAAGAARVDRLAVPSHERAVRHLPRRRQRRRRRAQPDGTYRYNALDAPAPERGSAPAVPARAHLHRVEARAPSPTAASTWAAASAAPAAASSRPARIATCRASRRGLRLRRTCVPICRATISPAPRRRCSISSPSSTQDDPAVDQAAIARGRAAASPCSSAPPSLELARRTRRYLDVRRDQRDRPQAADRPHRGPARVDQRARSSTPPARSSPSTATTTTPTAELDDGVDRRLRDARRPERRRRGGRPACPPGRTGHMALADTIEKDNRIPPRGFDNPAFDEARRTGRRLEPTTDGQYWDDRRFAMPAGAVRAEVTLYYQNTPRDYIEALRDGNVTDHWGETLHDLWSETGRGAPIAMASARRSRSPRPSVRRCRCLRRRRRLHARRLRAGWHLRASLRRHASGSGHGDRLRTRAGARPQHRVAACRGRPPVPLRSSARPARERRPTRAPRRRRRTARASRPRRRRA